MDLGEKCRDPECRHVRRHHSGVGFQGPCLSIGVKSGSPYDDCPCKIFIPKTIKRKVLAGNRRWVCPQCNDGLNAPTKMRRVDTRRYCLTCSAQSPTLVERVAPSAEAKRQARKEARAQRERAKRLQARLAKIKDPMKRAKLSSDAFYKEAYRDMEKMRGST